MTLYAIQFTMNQNKKIETKKRNNEAVCDDEFSFFQNFCNAIHLHYYTKRCESVLGTILRFCFYINE